MIINKKLLIFFILFLLVFFQINIFANSDATSSYQFLKMDIGARDPSFNVPFQDILSSP